MSQTRDTHTEFNLTGNEACELGRYFGMGRIECISLASSTEPLGLSTDWPTGFTNSIFPKIQSNDWSSKVDCGNWSSRMTFVIIRTSFGTWVPWIDQPQRWRKKKQIASRENKPNYEKLNKWCDSLTDTTIIQVSTKQKHKIIIFFVFLFLIVFLFGWYSCWRCDCM